jgi:FAD/FMN-containing dehydrogenase
LFSEILELVEPQDWFLPVTPGTKYVTVGGAIANDVHGKNHHREGTFGRHVRQLELRRTNGQRLVCSLQENGELFAATIGGLGLTGLIVWAEVQLKKVAGSAIEVETIKYRDLSSFFRLSKESDNDYEYTVAWIDCLASGQKLGRGHFMRGNHAPARRPEPHPAPKHKLSVPVDLPISLINGFTLKAFNRFYYHRQFEERRPSTVHFEKFFYPLDSIENWNRIYGPSGFLQFQCVVPVEVSEDAVREILNRIAHANCGSFLAVLKVFGDVKSPGMLSFPRPGATLALDFPYQGRKTLALFENLDEVVFQANGAMNPSKDAHMPAEHFRKYYSAVDEFVKYRDPGITSSFWRRVMEAS